VCAACAQPVCHKGHAATSLMRQTAGLSRRPAERAVQQTLFHASQACALATCRRYKHSCSRTQPSPRPGTRADTAPRPAPARRQPQRVASGSARRYSTVQATHMASPQLPGRLSGAATRRGRRPRAWRPCRAPVGQGGSRTNECTHGRRGQAGDEASVCQQHATIQRAFVATEGRGQQEEPTVKKTSQPRPR
jgi:hypothetical protein